MVSLSGLLVVNAGGVSAGATPARHDSKARITFTIDILPRKSIFTTGVWGQVRFNKKAVCGTAACTYRIYPGPTYWFTEKAVSAKKHPFQYWVLPNNKHSTAKSVRLKLMYSEKLIAEFKK